MLKTMSEVLLSWSGKQKFKYRVSYETRALSERGFHSHSHSSFGANPVSALLVCAPSSLTASHKSPPPGDLKRCASAQPDCLHTPSA